jgi:hypothetical protein
MSFLLKKSIISERRPASKNILARLAMRPKAKRISQDLAYAWALYFLFSHFHSLEVGIWKGCR